MDVRNPAVIGNFDSLPVGDGGHWTTKAALAIRWEWRADGRLGWLSEELRIPAGYRWDGASRPDFVGWLIPRGGVFLLASLVHDYCFKERPLLLGDPRQPPSRISRQHTDMLFLALMRMLAAERVHTGWKARAQVVMASVMWRAVRWFGEPVWDAHDKEYRGS